MAIGRNFKESLQKALVSLETGLSGLDNIFNYSKKEIEKNLKINIPNKILLIAEAFRKKIPFNKIYSLSKVDPWFLNQVKEIVDEEYKITKKGIPKTFNLSINNTFGLLFANEYLKAIPEIKNKIGIRHVFMSSINKPR